MARPTISNKRDQQLNIRLTMAELCWVRERAAAAGMRPTEFGRARLLSEGPHRESMAAPDRAVDRLWLTQLSRLGNNLNQIARQLNALRMPVPFDLVPILAELRRLLGEAAPK